jgi:hypothetical protein
MGRRDPIYDVETKALACRLINIDGLGPTAASKRLLELTGIAMPPESARKYAEKERRDTLPPVDQANPVGPMADRLIALANAELHALEVVRRAGTADLDRAAKIAKLLLDLDKLRKANAQPAEKADDSPLAGLMSDRKARSQNGREPAEPGSASPVHAGLLVQPVDQDVA